jgi:hypothetical protein
VALWPCLEQRKGPFRILGSPLPGWSTAYLGPLFPSGTDGADQQAILDAFLNERPLNRWSYFRCRVLDEQRDVDMEPLGFSRIGREETYLLDLGPSEDELWNNLKGECRSRIRKAQKAGIAVREELDDSFVDEFWQMSCEVFARSKLKPPFSRECIDILMRQLRGSDQVSVFTAYLDEHRIATLIMPRNDVAMYYWAGGSYQKFRDLPANNLLHWTAIVHAKRLGLKTYDFISTVGGPGRFKKTFGPEAHVVATHWEASRHRLIGALKNRYEWYLRSRRMLKV